MRLSPAAAVARVDSLAEEDRRDCERRGIVLNQERALHRYLVEMIHERNALRELVDKLQVTRRDSV